ncbi:HAD family hydrolase [Thermofilum pendens]|uniref:HAD-superfamily hydrolase, subfamily IA, variant 3 n=1 Tax=Thermofilum pendens (strain DSM 2475 / Hrk 5) TaxID=368408 RepID=A1RYS2_THEPD|nr:HAD family hydrolase [Thermofilum pendens]ABL78352.1 HAD-superfamily hydrolase, subfamily IA, variant 3 [Thermofilum pendens Hrk 5]
MLPGQAWRGVVVDLWGTLLYPSVSLEEYSRERARRIAEALRARGASLGEDEVLEAYKRARRLADRVRNITMIEVSLEGEVVMLLDELGLEPSEELVSEVSEAFIQPYLSLVKPAEGARGFLEGAKKMGYRLVLASNTMSTRHSVELLRRHGLAELFDYMAFSDSVGFRKPHPRFFAHIVAEAGIAPRESFFVGDEEADIRGAKLCGFKTIAYTGFHPYTGNTQPDCTAHSFDAVAECMEKLA